MDRQSMIRDIARLEAELKILKSSLDADKTGANFDLRKLGGLLVQYWVLVSFLIAIATAVFVKFRYDIEYFEDYENRKTEKDLAEFHRLLGDELMGSTEWAAAAQAYKNALEFDDNNKEAAFGLVKARVFEPLPGDTYSSGHIVDAKLDYLSTLQPDDYMLVFMRGMQAYFRRDYDLARALLNDSISQRMEIENEDFAGAHVMLGVISQEHRDLEGAESAFLRAVGADDENSIAHNNLGYVYLLQLDFDGAIKHLSRAESLAPSLLIHINMGDAYRFSGNVRHALYLHNFAVESARSIDEATYMGGTWTYNFMPVGHADKSSFNRYIRASSRDDKLSIATFAKSLDHALLGEFDSAEQTLSQALILDRTRSYRPFFINRMRASAAYLSLDETVQDWLLARERELAAP